MRGERGSSGYEVVFVVTEEQRDAYVDAIGKATYIDPRTGDEGPVRVKVVRTERFGEQGYSIGVQTRKEWAAADFRVLAYIDETFPVGTRARTLVPLVGNPGHPAGTLATVTKTEGYASPMFTFDGDPEGNGPFHVGPWWLEAI